MPPRRTLERLECSEGVRPRYAINCRGLSKRWKSPTCARPASRPTSPRNRDIQRSSGARPDTRVTPCRSGTANGSRKPSAGPKPSAAWHRPCIAASNGCARASFSPWRPTTSPGCHGCWPRNDEKPRGAHTPFGRLCCTNPVRDSSRESGVVAWMHEQTHIPHLQDQELAGL